MHTKVILPSDHGVADAFDKSYTRLDAMQVDIEAFLFLLPKDAKYTIYDTKDLFIDWSVSDEELLGLAKALSSLLNTDWVELSATSLHPKSYTRLVRANDWSIFIRRLEPLPV